jgi:SAM-dependent methyltransferase
VIILIAPNENRTNANAVLTLLGADSVSVADISPYENPDYLIDLNNRGGPEYNDKFDIIFDIGTLEHIFDVPTALENITRMLKPGGRVILVVPSSNYIDHGFYQFSPTLFYDFFSCNGFNSFSCYLIEGNPLNYLRKGKIWKYTGFGKECPLITPSGVETFFTAIKQNTHKEFEKPIQRLYANCAKEEEGVKQESLVKRVWDRCWKFCPEFIETLLLKKFRKNNNLVLLGRF